MKILSSEYDPEQIVLKLKKCLEYEYITESRQGRVYETIKNSLIDLNEFEVLFTVRRTDGKETK